jgi:predicted nucleic acid-binding protein
VDDVVALDAADISLSIGLGMADSIIYVTAQRYSATLVTADHDFEDLPGTVVVG